jgi:hypothetical protein
MLVTSRQFRWAQSSDHRLATTDATAEALGSGFLLATFVSLGVMAFNPAGGKFDCSWQPGDERD